MPFQDAPEPVADEETIPPHLGDPVALVLGEQIRDQLWMAAATDARSLQKEVGASEIGSPCERQIAYKAMGVKTANFPDPLRVIIGTGVHSAMEEMFTRIDGGSGRFLIESPLEYRAIPGTGDLYDHRRLALVDWKSSTKAKIRQIRKQGPQKKYVIQAHTYGAGLRKLGYQVETVALAFIPLDGDLSDIHVWTAALDVSIADEAIDRYERIVSDLLRTDPPNDPSGIEATPSRLCPWCSHYRPGSTDLSTGCPGNTEGSK